ncbi:MAG: cytochrome C [Pelagibacterium sp. SCN 63-23]|nr:MAG: cytochrome C [Pelagibacterium sp. SCN 63-23]
MTKLVLPALVLVAALAALWFWRGGDDLSSAAGARQVAEGRQLYLENCASCHGVNLEGQPDWQSPGPSGRLPPPPHDATGHTWHHSDGQLLAITRLGTAAIVGNGYESDMPGFADRLSDAQIIAVLDYVKSTWPGREAAYQRSVSDR